VLGMPGVAFPSRTERGRGMMTDGRSKRILISYSHDSPEHSARVRRLADRLVSEAGQDVRLDQYEPAPPQGWTRWMLEQVEEADFVLLICTETYRRRFEGKDKGNDGRGVDFEARLLAQHLYTAKGDNARFLPVLLDGANEQNVPIMLRDYARFRVPREWEALVRHFTGQPAVVRPELGEVPSLRPTPAAEDGGPEERGARGRRRLAGAALFGIAAVALTVLAVLYAGSEGDLRGADGPGCSPTGRTRGRTLTVLDGTSPMRFVRLTGGRFLMGSGDDDRAGLDHERPAHCVNISPFPIADTELTQAQYAEVTGKRPSSFPGSNRPVEHVSWCDALVFCNALSDRLGLQPVYTFRGSCEDGGTVDWDRDANGSRLPTEAEWEFAARAGTTTLSPEEQARAREALDWYRLAGSLNGGGIGMASDPNDLHTSARIHAQLGELERTRVLLDQIEHMSKPNESLALERFMIGVSLDSPDEVLQWVDDRLVKEVRWSNLRATAVQWSLAMGNLAAASRLSLGPEAQKYAALSSLQQGNLDAAIGQLRRYTISVPQDALAWATLGQVLLVTGDIAGADEAIAQARATRSSLDAAAMQDLDVELETYAAKRKNVMSQESP